MKGFFPDLSDHGAVTPFEYLPCGAITPKAGLALVLTNGLLALATGATAPTYICMKDADAAVTAGTIIPVVRVDKDRIYETTNSAAFSSAITGQKVTLHTDGLQVTATTTNGVAEIVDFDDKAKSGAGEADLWAALGYDFVRFTALLGAKQNSAEAFNQALATAASSMSWSMSPMRWISGKASQDLFLFQPTASGMIEADLGRMQASRAGRQATRDARGAQSQNSKQ